MHSSCSMKKEFHGFVIIVVIEKMIRTFLGKCDTKFIIPGIWWYVSCLKTFCFVYYTSIISGTNKFEILVMGICLVENVIQEDIYIYILCETWIVLHYMGHLFPKWKWEIYSIVEYF